MRNLYSGEYGLLFQHITPGLPVVVAIFEGMFGRSLWPAITIFQNLVNALACVYFIDSFEGRIGKSAQALFVVLISLFPYYAAFHNAVLTESLSASIMLFLLGTAFRCLDGRMRALPAIFIILGLMFVGAQFRSYLAGVGVGIALLLTICRTQGRRLALGGLVVLTFAASILAFPLYRAAVGVRFFLPNNDPWMLGYVSYVVWDYNSRSRHALDGVVFDPAIRHKLVATMDDLTQADVIKMVNDLAAHGVGRAEVDRRIAHAARIIRVQSLGSIRRQVQLSLSSLGFERLSTCCNRRRTVSRGPTTNADELAHLQYYQKWNAQLDDNYSDLFATFARTYRQTPELYSAHAIGAYVEGVGPYVPSGPNPWRDVLGLGSISPDLLILIGIAGLALLAKGDWRAWTILLLPCCLSMARHCGQSSWATIAMRICFGRFISWE